MEHRILFFTGRRKLFSYTDVFGMDIRLVEGQRDLKQIDLFGIRKSTVTKQEIEEIFVY